MKALIDTSILIDHLNAVDDATTALNTYDAYISSITMNEIVRGAKSPNEYESLLDLLSNFEVINIDRETYQTAFALQREKGLDLQNALIYATAKQAGLMLVTGNSRDFNSDWLDVKIPYTT